MWIQHLEWVKSQIKLRDKKEEPIKVDEELPNYIMESEPLVSKSTTVIGNRLIQGDFEETWADILEKFSNSEDCRFINDAEEFCNWLSENYNVPIKK